MVEHDPASMIHSVGYGHQRLVDVGDLEHDGLCLPFVGLELQADLPDVGNPMVGRGHIVQPTSRPRRWPDLLGVDHALGDDRVARAGVCCKSSLQSITTLLDVHRAYLDQVRITLHEALIVGYGLLLGDGPDLAVGVLDVVLQDVVVEAVVVGVALDVVLDAVVEVVILGDVGICGYRNTSMSVPIFLTIDPTANGTVARMLIATKPTAPLNVASNCAWVVAGEALPSSRS